MSAFGRAGAVVAATLVVLALPAAALGAITFRPPVFVSDGVATQAAEPSIRVDATDAHERIWVAAPQGITVRLFPEQEGGDIFWYSDDDGNTWTLVGDATIVGGGDTDVATTTPNPATAPPLEPDVFGTGLTLANITLSASCDEGNTWLVNPFSNLGTVEDRQWIDSYEDTPIPLTAPQFVLDYGGVAERRMWFHQVFSPACAPPAASARLDVSHPECLLSIFDPNCYQWPGNLAVDENTGDVYVTHNTFGNETAPFDDDVVVARVNGGASRPVTQLDVLPFVAANNRPDTFDSFTVVAVDRASNVYVVWSERRPEVGRTDTMYTYSTDRGATWHKPMRVSKVNTTTFPWIVAGDAGRIDIVYYGTTATGPSPEEVPDDSRWRVYMAQSLNAASKRPKFIEVAATPFMHQGFICTSGLGCPPGTRDLLDFFQVDVDRVGLANIAYTDNLNTPPDGTDPHQEWITFVQQRRGGRLYVP